MKVKNQKKKNMWLQDMQQRASERIENKNEEWRNK